MQLETRAAGEATKEADSKSATDLLAEIGITETVLLTALQVGDAAAAVCTPNHPPMAAGFYRFSETVCSLAEQLASPGWTRRDYKNFSTVVRPDNLVAIAVASGDHGTGDLSLSVTTKSPKGITTVEAIEANLLLPYDDLAEAENSRLAAKLDTTEAAPVTYFLLHDRRDGFIYAELSRPSAINDQGYVVSWVPRIPLTPVAITAEAVPLSEPEPPATSEVIVKRRENR